MEIYSQCGSTTAPGFAKQTVPGPLTAGGPRASPTQTRKFSLKPVGEGLAPPAGQSGTGPYEKNASAPLFVVGAAHRAARERADEDIGLYKNAAALVSTVPLSHT